MNNTESRTVPSVSVTYARNGASTKANALGMRPMQERAYEKRGEQYLLIKSPPASGKSRALMFVALDKLKNQGIKQAIIVVPEKLSLDFSIWRASASLSSRWGRSFMRVSTEIQSITPELGHRFGAISRGSTMEGRARP